MNYYIDGTQPGFSTAPGYISLRTKYVGIAAQVAYERHDSVTLAIPIIALEYRKSVDEVRTFTLSLENSFLKRGWRIAVTILVGKPNEKIRAALAEQDRQYQAQMLAVHNAIKASLPQPPVDSGTITEFGDGTV